MAHPLLTIITAVTDAVFGNRRALANVAGDLADRDALALELARLESRIRHPAGSARAA